MSAEHSPKTPRVAVASSSVVAADAATRIIESGGNAVDAAVAAAFVSINTEPGVCALAGGAYVTVWPHNGDPLCIDGYARVPGVGSTSGASVAPEAVHMEYGGGITTLVGAATVAVPGTPAALWRVHRQFGDLPWSECLQPAIETCRDGFPLPSACHHYLTYSGRAIFGRSETGFRALHPDGEHLAEPGTAIVLPGLADSLDAIAREGVAAFYQGDIGHAIVNHVRDGGGCMTRQDLACFEPVVRRAAQHQLGDWQLALPPPPSIGGSMLQAILMLTEQGGDPIRSMQACLEYRRRHVDFADDLPRATRELLDAARDDRLSSYASANTVHTSAVDSAGLACAITASSGYGCGEIPHGTGLWLNNCLGEIELNRRGVDAGPPGAALPTNMAPAAARRSAAVLAIGSPGADRITSAMLQTLVGHLVDGIALADAIAAPRWHLEMALETDASTHASVLHTEPGAHYRLPAGAQLRAHNAKGMYFGGVGAAAANTRTHEAMAVADPRRVGGTTVAHKTPSHQETKP